LILEAYKAGEQNHVLHSKVKAEIQLLKDSRSGDRAFGSGSLFQSEIVRGKKECLYNSLLEDISLKLYPTFY
jgi:hypothetical protein